MCQSLDLFKVYRKLSPLFSLKDFFIIIYPLFFYNVYDIFTLKMKMYVENRVKYATPLVIFFKDATMKMFKETILNTQGEGWVFDVRMQ